ncbi:hypothetical protein [Yinghuangia sp. YIM S10712]|uniref:hypothetical protein n=1 Tax=Yinghuangia sp. YIM S10712 TaxID=3436930 RepID=UPI003F5304C8
MRTRTSAIPAALVAAVLGSMALTACELPGQDDKKNAGASSSPSAPESPSASAQQSAAASASASTAPKATDQPSAKPTGRNSTSAAPTKAAGPRTLVPTASTAGYVRYTGDGTLLDVPVDPGEMTDKNNLVMEEYAKNASGPREVLFVGVDGLASVDGKRMEHMIRGMIDWVNADGGSVPEGASMQSYAAGPLGGTLECMPAQDAYPAAICAWADTNTVAVAYFDKLSADAAAVKFVEMRSDLEK